MSNPFVRNTFKFACGVIICLISYGIVNLLLDIWNIIVPPYFVGTPEIFIGYYNQIQYAGALLVFTLWLLFCLTVTLINSRRGVVGNKKLCVAQTLLTWAIVIVLFVRFCMILAAFGFFSEVLTSVKDYRLYMILVPSLVYGLAFFLLSSCFFVHVNRTFRIENPPEWAFWLR